VAASQTNSEIHALNSVVSKVISGLQEEVHLVRSELRMVRTIIEDYRKESLEREKIVADNQQLSTQKYEDLTNKLINILGSTELLSCHLPGNSHGSIPTHTAAPPDVGNSIATAMTPVQFDTTNQFNPQSIATLASASNRQSNIPILRATGVSALDQLLPSNRPHIPLLEKQFPATFREVYDEYQRLNLYQYERNGSKSAFSSQQQSLFSKRYRAMKLVRTLAAQYKPPKSILEVITLLDNELQSSPLTMTNFLNRKYDMYSDHKKRKRE
jgi:hypothetical protein